MTSAIPWTPEVGMVLRSQAVDYKVRVLARRQFVGMAFWEVVIENYREDAGKSWLIHEPWFIEQYSPISTKT